MTTRTQAIRMFAPGFLLRLAASMGLVALMGLAGMMLDQAILPWFGLYPAGIFSPFFLVSMLLAIQLSHHYLRVPRTLS